MITKHALIRVCQRVGIRDEESAEAFVMEASAKGRESSSFPVGSIREFLEGKAHTGNRVVVHKGIVVVFGSDGHCVTAYPLPSALIEAYRRETTNNHD